RAAAVGRAADSSTARGLPEVVWSPSFPPCGAAPAPPPAASRKFPSSTFGHRRRCGGCVKNTLSPSGRKPLPERVHNRPRGPGQSVRKRRGGPPSRLLRIVSQTAGEGNHEFLFGPVGGWRTGSPRARSRILLANC